MTPAWRWEVRIRQLHRLLWAMLASLVMQPGSKGLDLLSAAAWSEEAYARALAHILRRIGERDQAA